MRARTSSLFRLSATAAALLAAIPASALAGHRAHPPSVSTCCATGIGSTSSTVNGSVNPNGASTTYYFQYGTTTSYGSSTPAAGAGSSTSSVSAVAGVSGLAPGTTYHFRVVASNGGGTSYGSDLTFSTTSPDTTPPTAPTNLAATAGDAQVSLTWGSSTDNVGVTGYAVFRNGVQVATLTTTGYTDTGLTDGMSYSYYIEAYDAAGNDSSPSSVVSATPVSSVAGSSYDSVVAGDRPVAFWDMNNPSGTEPDLTGNGHSGTYNGGTATLTSMLNGDRAVDFNGSSEYMTVPSSAAFSIPTTGQLTWEGWIRPDVLQWSSASDPTNQGYVTWMGKCQNYSPSCEWEARMYSSVNSESRCNRLSAYVFNPTAGYGSGAFWQPNCNLLQAGQWLHVVAEYQTQTTPSACGTVYPGTVNIWVNGIEWDAADHYPTGCLSQYSITPQAGSSPLDIGTMAMDSWFPGAVGKVAIYNHLLSQSQINAHFAAMTGAQPSGSCVSTGCTTAVPTP
jgi:chitodextrinase